MTLSTGTSLESHPTGALGACSMVVRGTKRRGERLQRPSGVDGWRRLTTRVQSYVLDWHAWEAEAGLMYVDCYLWMMRTAREVAIRVLGEQPFGVFVVHRDGYWNEQLERNAEQFGLP